MTTSGYVILSLVSGTLITVLMTGVLLIQHRLGFDHSIRDAQGRVRSGGTTPLAWLMPITVLLIMICVPVGAGFWLDRTMDVRLSFSGYFLLAYGIFFVANLWDLLILDYLVLLKLRPRFLELPDTLYYTTFRPHLRGWARGLLFGIVSSLLAALVCHFAV